MLPFGISYLSGLSTKLLGAFKRLLKKIFTVPPDLKT